MPPVRAALLIDLFLFSEFIRSLHDDNNGVAFAANHLSERIFHFMFLRCILCRSINGFLSPGGTPEQQFSTGDGAGVQIGNFVRIFPPAFGATFGDPREQKFSSTAAADIEAFLPVSQCLIDFFLIC